MSVRIDQVVVIADYYLICLSFVLLTDDSDIEEKIKRGEDKHVFFLPPDSQNELHKVTNDITFLQLLLHPTVTVFIKTISRNRFMIMFSQIVM